MKKLKCRKEEIMKRIYMNQLPEHFNEEIRVDGYIDRIRDLQYVQFIVLRDKTGKVQVTIEKNEENKEMNDFVSTLTVESTVKVVGTLSENEKVKLNGYEIFPKNIEVTSKSDPDLVFNYKDEQSAMTDTRLDYRFLDLRNEKHALIFKIQSYMVKLFRDFLYEQSFMEIHTPKLIGAASESGSEVFEVKYFDRKAYLAQSPQFYKQMAMSSGFERVFEVGPAFRAENSNSNRHATEFTSIDLEFSYIDSFYDVMHMEQEMLIYMLKHMKETYGEEIKNVFHTEVIVPTKDFPVIKLSDLYKELEKRYGYQIPEEDVGDLNAETEKLAFKFAMEEYQSEFLFITDFSKAKRPFYHMRENDVPQGYDLIWRGVEITTGAQREHRYDVLKKQAEEKGLGDDVKFYLEFFKYGCPPHGGFGLGMDRLTMLLLELPHLREAMFLYRNPSRLTP